MKSDKSGGDSKAHRQLALHLTSPAKTLAAGLFYRAYLRAHAGRCDTRVAAAIGPIDFVPRKKVSEGDGEAFRLSGQLLKSGLVKRRMASPATVTWQLVGLKESQ